MRCSAIASGVSSEGGTISTSKGGKIRFCVAVSRVALLYASMFCSRGPIRRFPGVRSITANFFGLTSWKSHITHCMKRLPPIIIGIMTRLTTNALVRTAARYSRPRPSFYA